MNMKSKTILIAVLLPLLVISISCKKEWDEHYNNPPETVDKNLWEDLQLEEDLSMFVDAIKEFEYDTLFDSDNTYTLFVPDNDAVTAFLETGEISPFLLNYHISKHFIQSGFASGSKMIQTLGEKFVRFDKLNNVTTYDGIPLELESPLYRNGKYFKLGAVAPPRQNLFEYFEENNPIFKDYILSQDSIIIDKAESIPIGFDEFGNTVYDTVATIYNEFEDLYFPVREESRNKTATIVFPNEENYHAALDAMATALGDTYTDHSDIPMEWQNDILIPYLLDHGVFPNRVEPIEFIFTGPPTDTLKLKNILGDSIAIDYEPMNKAICSNGYAYDYKNFQVPDTLFSGTIRFEGEWLLKSTGVNKYAWLEDVNVQSDVSFTPSREYSASSSNDSLLFVDFNNGYSGNYSMEFNIDNLFPRRYLMVVRTSVTIGGIFNIYFNGDLVKTIDSYDYVLNPWIYPSVIPGKVYRPENGFSRYDCWLDNTNPYGQATIKYEWVGPGSMPSSGLIFDFIDFVPDSE